MLANWIQTLIHQTLLISSLLCCLICSLILFPNDRMLYFLKLNLNLNREREIEMKISKTKKKKQIKIVTEMKKFGKFGANKFIKYSKLIGFWKIEVKIPSDFFFSRIGIWWTKNKQENQLKFLIIILMNILNYVKSNRLNYFVM